MVFFTKDAFFLLFCLQILEIPIETFKRSKWRKECRMQFCDNHF